MQTFIGFEDNALVYNRQYSIADGAPDLHRVGHAFLSPVHPTVEGNLLEELAGGVFGPDGMLRPECLQPRSDGRNAISPAQVPHALPRAKNTLPRAVFGGVVFDHFGHFLLETTARLWALPEHRHLPWIFVTGGRTDLLGYQRAFLETLGLGHDQIVVCAEWMEVEDLVVPDPAFIYHHHAWRAYAETFRRADVGTSAHVGGRVFLSRSDTTIARTIGEHELEDVLRADGWDIVVPERLPAAEQAAIFRSDNVVMGLQGSAMHLGLFGRPGRRVVHLCRGQGYRGYYVLDDLVDAEGLYIHAMQSPPLASKPITGPFLLDLDAAVRHLREHELIGPRAVAASKLSPEAVRALEEDYAAWWHYTESQIRFHRQLADDGSLVDRRTALDSALRALAIRPNAPTILCHALALMMKFEGNAAAAALLAAHVKDDAVIDESGDPQLLYFASMIREAAGDAAGAIEAARRCVALAPANATYVNQLATALYRRGMLDDAEQVLQALIDTGRAAPDNLFVLSLVFRKRRDTANALRVGLAAVAADHASEPIATHVGDLLIEEGRFDEARDVYLEFIKRVPEAVPMLRRLAALERRMGLLDEARQHLTEAYRHDPNDPVLRAECRTALIAAGRFPDLDGVGTLLTPARTEQAIMLYKRSRTLNAADLPARAVYAACRAVELDPGNPTIRQMLFSLMLRARRPAEAHLLAVSLIEIGLGNAGVHYVVSLTETELGRREAAAAAARRAMELEPANDVIRQHYERLCAS